MRDRAAAASSPRDRPGHARPPPPRSGARARGRRRGAGDGATPSARWGSGRPGCRRPRSSASEGSRTRRPGPLVLDSRDEHRGAGRGGVAARPRAPVVAELVREAARPADGPVPAGAEAVLFRDRTELLACLAEDRAAHDAPGAGGGGRSPAGFPRRPRPPGSRSRSSCPPVVALLARRGTLGAVLAALDPGHALAVAERVLAMHGIGASSGQAAAVGRRGGGRRAAPGPVADPPAPRADAGAATGSATRPPRRSRWRRSRSPLAARAHARAGRRPPARGPAPRPRIGGQPAGPSRPVERPPRTTEYRAWTPPPSVRAVPPPSPRHHRGTWRRETRVPEPPTRPTRGGCARMAAAATPPARHHPSPRSGASRPTPPPRREPAPPVDPGDATTIHTRLGGLFYLMPVASHSGSTPTSRGRSARTWGSTRGTSSGSWGRRSGPGGRRRRGRGGPRVAPARGPRGAPRRHAAGRGLDAAGGLARRGRLAGAVPTCRRVALVVSARPGSGWTSRRVRRPRRRGPRGRPERRAACSSAATSPRLGRLPVLEHGAVRRPAARAHGRGGSRS